MIHGLDTSFWIAHEVSGHAKHHSARARLSELKQAGDQFALTPLVIAEFIHVVTDPKRHTHPLNMDQALGRAEAWLQPTVAPDAGCCAGER
jgi:predicted nucleic acid-binding protein